MEEDIHARKFKKKKPPQQFEDWQEVVSYIGSETTQKKMITVNVLVCQWWN